MTSRYRTLVSREFHKTVFCSRYVQLGIDERNFKQKKKRKGKGRKKGRSKKQRRVSCDDVIRCNAIFMCFMTYHAIQGSDEEEEEEDDEETAEETADEKEADELQRKLTERNRKVPPEYPQTDVRIQSPL